MRITTNSKTERRFFMEQIAIFCDTDDFCRAYEEYCRNKLLMDKEEVIPRTRMSLSEIMTILIMYQLSGYKTFILTSISNRTHITVKTLKIESKQ